MNGGKGQKKLVTLTKFDIYNSNAFFYSAKIENQMTSTKNLNMVLRFCNVCEYLRSKGLLFGIFDRLIEKYIMKNIINNEFCRQSARKAVLTCKPLYIALKSFSHFLNC